MNDHRLLGRRWVRVALAMALAAAIGLGVFLAIRGEDRVANAPPPEPRTSEAEPMGSASGGADEGGAASTAREGSRTGGEDADDRQDRRRLAERDAERTYRDYVDAINARDGERLCALLAPGFERSLDPPADAAACPATLRRSIGAERRGRPTWDRTVLVGAEPTAVGLDDERVRITAEIITEFADRTEPSIESDIAYLERAGAGWRLAKASGALHRAVGKPDFPPSVISPPPGWEP